MRIGLDATPLLGQLTGIGHYVDQLIRTLSAEDPELELVATAFSLRGRGQLPSVVPASVEIRARGLPARALQWAWQHTELPPVQLSTGPLDLFHGTNFVLPPTGTAAGVVTVHDLSYLHYPETVSAASLRYRELVPRSIARAQIVCTLTESMRDEIAAEYQIDPSRIQVTYPGVDDAWFSVRAPDHDTLGRLGLPERYLLAVGTLEPRKNIAHLLSAYSQLRHGDSSLPPIVLAGGAGWGPALELAGLPPEAVIKTGYLNDDDLRSVVAGATCLAFPSVYEGFGLPPVEALACGVAVIATDLPVTREVLGAAAQLIAPGDTDALAEALRLALDAEPDPAARERRIAQARRWTWQQCAAQTRQAYRDALSA